MRSRQALNLLLLTLALFCYGFDAQANASALPDAPSAKNLPADSETTGTGAKTTPAASSAAGTPHLLTRQEAEKIALANNPAIHISKLLAKVQHQVLRERRADELPNLAGNLTVVGANTSRISSGSLDASRLLSHAGEGVELRQLITDFGRTSNLIASAKLQEKARLADTEASREDIVLATDQVFYQTVEAQATLKVAVQTVAARQTLTDQVSALAASKLRSDLDLSFAQVNLSQARLLQLDAQNNLGSAKAALSDVLGFDRQTDYELVDDSNNLPPLSPDPEPLIAQAIANRPDLQSLVYSERAAQKFSKAQHQQLLPTISALGVVGQTSIGSPLYFTTDWYGAVGANLSIPIFNGFRFSAQALEAKLQAQEASEQTRALRDHVARDVRVAWLNANTALQRVAVTAQLLAESNTALDLASTRYKFGLSSIVELSQAQLQQTEAAISNASARAQYNLTVAALNFQIGVQP